MALLRLLCFPSTTTTTYFSSQLQLSPPTTSISSLHKPPPRHHFLFSLSPLPSIPLFTSSSLSIKTEKPNFFQLNFSSSIAAETPALEQSETAEEEEEEEEEEVSNTRLLASNVPWSCTADDLRPLFEKYGAVLDIELSMYNKTRNRGLAFISMGSPEEALAAFNNLESYEFEGRTLKLNWAKPKKKPSPPPQPKPVPIHNLFVANLPFYARARELKEFFNSENANAVTAEIVYHDNPRRSSGYGFVSFNTKREADEALSKFQGKEFMGRPIRVAPSKKFLRKQTSDDTEPEIKSAELNSQVEHSQSGSEA